MIPAVGGGGAYHSGAFHQGNRVLQDVKGDIGLLPREPALSDVDLDIVDVDCLVVPVIISKQPHIDLQAWRNADGIQCQRGGRERQRKGWGLDSRCHFSVGTNPMSTAAAARGREIGPGIISVTLVSAGTCSADCAGAIDPDLGYSYLCGWPKHCRRRVKGNPPG